MEVRTMRKILYLLSATLVSMSAYMSTLFVNMPWLVALPGWCFVAIVMTVAVAGAIVIYKEGKRNERN
jgi:hypothetical protein